jgi:hypothetical protein
MSFNILSGKAVETILETYGLPIDGDTQNIVIFFCQNMLNTATQSVSCILGASAKLRKATSSSIVSVRPSVRVEQLSCHLTDLMEFDI